MTHVNNTRSCIYSLDAPDDERKYRSKHVERSRNNKLLYTVASCWSFLEKKRKKEGKKKETPCAVDRQSASSNLQGVCLNERIKFLFGSYTFNVNSLPLMPSNEADLNYSSDVMKHVSSAISVISESFLSCASNHVHSLSANKGFCMVIPM
jgi:hypothetical protein